MNGEHQTGIIKPVKEETKLRNIKLEVSIKKQIRIREESGKDLFCYRIYDDCIS